MENFVVKILDQRKDEHLLRSLIASKALSNGKIEINGQEFINFHQMIIFLFLQN